MAKLAIGARGDVTRVEIENESRQNRQFERAARVALLQWRFPEGSSERVYRTEVSFKSPSASPSDGARAGTVSEPRVAPPPEAPARAAPLAGGQTSLQPLSRVAPDFPRDARGDARTEVTLQARLAINAKGEVTRVDFENASPSNRPFERAARAALLQWRFPEGSGERVSRAEISFKP